MKSWNTRNCKSGISASKRNANKANRDQQGGSVFSGLWSFLCHEDLIEIYERKDWRFVDYNFYVNGIFYNI